MRNRSSAPSRPTARCARWILIVALAVRLAVRASHDPDIFHSQDSVEYVLLAKSLASSGQFAIDGQPELSRTPGYPLFLVPAAASGQLEFVTILLQILLSVLTVSLVFRIGWEVF